MFNLKYSQFLQNTEKLWTPLSWAFIFFGICIRIWQYMHCRSLWIDEAMLARNIIDRNFLELLNPLDFNQGAPVLFLWITKCVTTFFGTGELALRFFPLIISILGIILFYFIAKRLLEAPFIVIALFIFSLSPRLIYYAQEFKQYASDVTITLVILYLFLRYLEKNNNFELALLCLLGSIATFISYPSIFIISSVSSTFILFKYKKQIDISLFKIALIITIWFIGFCVNYFIFLRQLSENSYLTSFWNKGFLPIPTSVNDVTTWINTVQDFLKFSGFTKTIQIVPFLMSGIAVIYGIRKRSASIVTVAMVFFFAFCAAILHKYPFERRLALYAIPVFILLAVKGAEIISKKRSYFIILPICLILVSPTFKSISNMTKYIEREEIKPVLEYLDSQIEQNDKIYVYYGAEHALNYYKKNELKNFDSWHIGTSSRDNKEKYVTEIDSMKKFKRVWFLFSHIFKDEEKFFLSHINGKILEQRIERGAHLYLFQFEN